MSELRPETLEEYVGQEHIKQQILRACASAKLRNEALGHILLTGPAGLGKTSLAKVISNTMGVGFEQSFATSITKPDDLKEILRTKLDSTGYVSNNMNPVMPSSIRPTILFIDEIHNLPLKVRETLYTVMEDRIYWEERKNPWNGRKESTKTWVPMFTLIGATTREGVLEKPFLDRFRYNWKVERYTPEECRHFVKRTIDKTQSQVAFTVADDVIAAIAIRARGTARVAIQLTERCIDFLLGEKDCSHLDMRIASRAFEGMRIDDLGLNPVDYKILCYLYRCYRPVGLKSLASVLEEMPASIEMNYEPYLVSRGYIIRTPSGRVISEEGAKLLEQKKLVDKSNRRTFDEDLH